MKKKGFTLVELLAVIVVLGIIALIIVPNVIELVRKSERDSFEKSAYGVLTSAKEYYQSKMEEKNFDGVTFDFEKEVPLELEGDIPTSGTVTINPKGLVEIYVSNGTYCAIKKLDSEEIKVVSLKEVGTCGGEIYEPVVDGFDIIDVKPKEITVAAHCIASEEDPNLKVSHYEFMIYEEGKEEEGKWIESKSSSYTFKNLKQGTNYLTKAKCINERGIESEEKGPVEAETGNQKVSCSVIPTSNTWLQEKKVSVTYSVDSNYTKEYSLDGRTWKTVDDNSIELSFNKPANVFVRVTEGTEVEQTLCSVNKVDSTAPTSELKIIEVSEIDQFVTVGAYCTDAESGIKLYEYGISKTKVENFDDLEEIHVSTSNAYKFKDLEKESSYYVYVRCTNNAGLSSTSEAVETNVKDFEHVSCEIDNNGYTNTGKTVTVHYPKNYTNTYKVISETNHIASIDGNKLESNKVYTTTSLEEKILVESQGSVFAQIENSTGNKESVVCNVNNIDKVAPTVSVKSKPNVGEWYYKDKEIVLTKNDDGGSGIYSYYVSKKNVKPKFSSVCKTSDTNDDWVCNTDSENSIYRGLSYVPENGPETYYIWVQDGAGNVSEGVSILIDKIEDTKPTCTLTIETGSMGNDEWYVSDVKVKITTNDPKEDDDYYDPSGVNSWGIYTNQTGVMPSPAFTSTTDIFTLNVDGVNYIYGFVKDNAGNINQCDNILTIKRDVTKPSCTITAQTLSKTGSVVGEYEDGTWTEYNTNTRVSAKDNASKVKKIEIIPSGATGSEHVVYDDENQLEKDEYYINRSEGESIITAEITDYAGNTRTCLNLTIKQDHTTSITAIKNPLTLGNSDYSFLNNVTSTYYGGSGTTVCSPANSRKTKTYDVTCTATSSVNNFSQSVTFTAKHQYPATGTYHPKTCSKLVNPHSCCERMDPVECNHYDNDGIYDLYGEGKNCSKCGKWGTCYDHESYDCSYTSYSCPNGGTLNESDKNCYF